MDERLKASRTAEQWAAYHRGEGEDWEYGEPDDENPELTDEQMLWRVSPSSFGGNVHASLQFMTEREEFLRTAAAAGVPRETFLPYRPNEPGFMDRARDAFTALPKAMGWAAE